MLVKYSKYNIENLLSLDILKPAKPYFMASNRDKNSIENYMEAKIS